MACCSNRPVACTHERIRVSVRLILRRLVCEGNARDKRRSASEGFHKLPEGVRYETGEFIDDLPSIAWVPCFTKQNKVPTKKFMLSCRHKL